LGVIQVKAERGEVKSTEEYIKELEKETTDSLNKVKK
jgi:hypothetical protein